MTEQPIMITTVHHAATDIAVSPDRLWTTLREGFIEARKFRDFGFSIDPIDEPGVPLGGYRMRLEQDGKIVDDRICRISEVDDTARRLSIFADYLSHPLGLQVYVTYQAHETATGCRYTLDCHARQGITPPSDAAEIAALIASMKQGHDAGLDSSMAKVKAELETPA